MSGAWVYVKSKGEELWTVGFYKPDGTWEAESDHSNPDDAADRVHFLNGGTPEKNLTTTRRPTEIPDLGA